jgi:hypothetical protein
MEEQETALNLYGAWPGNVGRESQQKAASSAGAAAAEQPPPIRFGEGERAASQHEAENAQVAHVAAPVHVTMNLLTVDLGSAGRRARVHAQGTVSWSRQVVSD